MFILYRSPGLFFFFFSFHKELAIAVAIYLFIYLFFPLQGLSVNHSPSVQPFSDTDLSGHGAEPQALLLQDHPAGDLSQGPGGSFPDPPVLTRLCNGRFVRDLISSCSPGLRAGSGLSSPKLWDLGGMLPARKLCKKGWRAAPSGSGYKELIGQERLKSMNHIFVALLEGLPKEREKGGKSWMGSSRALIPPPSLGRDL